MTLPNGHRAVVDIRKLTDYCLNPLHRQGRHKARVFAAVGIRQSDAEELRTALLAAAANVDAEAGAETIYGWHYLIDFDLNRADRTVRIRSAWIVRRSDWIPRLTTGFILREKVRL